MYLYFFFIGQFDSKTAAFFWVYINISESKNPTNLYVMVEVNNRAL